MASISGIAAEADINAQDELTSRKPSRGFSSRRYLRVAVATAYIDDVNERLVRYLAASDLAVTAIRGVSLGDQ